VVGTIADQLRKERHPAGADLVRMELSPESCVRYLAGTLMKGTR
jgi:hypothetical protein